MLLKRYLNNKISIEFIRYLFVGGANFLLSMVLFLLLLKVFYVEYMISFIITWLFGILKNKIAEHFRSKLKHPQIHIDNEESLELFFDNNGKWNKHSRPSEWDINEEQLLDNGDFNRIFEQCMNNLPDQWYSCVSMKFLEEKDPKIVCQELGLSTTNYWQILHRAKLQLRECLEHHWFHL